MVLPGRNTAVIDCFKGIPKREVITSRFLSIRPQADLVQQALAADGAIACFSSNFVSARLECYRAPQLKRISVMPFVISSKLLRREIDTQR
jgi:hypothetical protein